MQRYIQTICVNFNFQKNQSKVQAKEMLHLAWKTLTASTDWKYEKSCSETGDVIASRQSEEGRKIFKLTVSSSLIYHQIEIVKNYFDICLYKL